MLGTGLLRCPLITNLPDSSHVPYRTPRWSSPGTGMTRTAWRPCRSSLSLRLIREKKPKDIEVYLASDVESDGEGTDFALSVSDSEASEDGKVVLKRRARSKFQSLLEDLNDGDGKEGGEDNDDQDLRESSREIVFESGLKEAGEEMLRKVQAKKALRDETAWQTTMREKKKKRDARKNTKKSIPNAAAAGAAAADNDDDGEDEDGTHDNLLEDSDDMMAHVADDPFFAPFSTKAKKNKKKNKTSTTKDTTTNDAGDQQDQVKKRMTMELLLMDDDDEGGGGQGRRGYSLRALEDDYEREQNKGQKGGSARKKKKKKKKCGNEDDYEGGTKMSDDFTVNVTDERFKGMFRDPNFAIDPTSPAFKNTKGTHLLIAEGRKQHMDKKKGKKNSHNKARTQQQPKDEDDANAKNRGGSSGVARGIKDAALRSIIGRVKAKQHETTSHHQQAKNKKQNNPKSTMTMLGKKTKKKKKKKKSA
uniref:NUC153 domain-containing protein n=1 Tax=Lotharella globosa TaxID=91324 RepID=A0A7S3YNT4_9EUKA